MLKRITKPHIRELPVVKYPEYKSTNSTELAVSIPLFYSAKESGVMVDFDIDNFKSTQVKGAVWAAIAIYHNTDLVDKGVGLYFHVEDKVLDYVNDVMSEFGVPKELIKVCSIDTPDLNIAHTQYGKKLMCLDDTEIIPERWLIVDTDAFLCSTDQQIFLYDKLVALNSPATLQFNKNSATDDKTWTSALCKAVGLPFDADSDFFMQQQRAFYKAGFPYYSHASEAQAANRPFVASQLALIPTQHPICSFLKTHYKRCYQDEFLLGMWDIKCNGLSSLSEYLDLPVFYYVDEYLARDKGKDAEGYVLHYHHADTEKLQDNFDACYTPLLAAMEQKKTSTDRHISLKERFSDKLQRTASDKHTAGGHKYGLFYDMVFDSVAKRQGRKLRVLEIGVSFFGEGSLKAYQEMDIIQEVVGIDVLPYEGELAEHTTFHKVADAYSHKTIQMLKQAHESFDIIIDDGSHDPKDQEFFMHQYYQLVADGGSLICEDVYDPDFFKQMCVEPDIFGYDGWANLTDDKKMTDYHNERLLVREKRETPDTIQVPTPKNSYVPKNKFRFHLLGIAYGPTQIDFSVCAFVQKTRKGANMLHKLGHEVIHYGHDRSELECTEHVSVTNDIVLQRTYGTSDHNGAPEGYNVNDLAFTTFDINTESELRKRVEPGDFVLASFPHQQLYERLSDLPIHFIEWGIGYSHIYSPNLVFESQGWQMFHRGKQAENGKKASNVADWRSVVIPNYFDPNEFKYKEDKGDYILYLGRVDPVKGVDLVLEASRRTGIPVKLAGPNMYGDELFNLLPHNAEYLGILNSEQRNDYMSNAKVVACPSLYLEPFLGVHIESGFCGRPIVTTNWGAPVEFCKHGITGYRFQTGEQLVWALENIDNINSQDCYDWAYNNFSMDRISITYHEYFNSLYRNINGYFWDEDDTRTNLDWLRMNMTTDQIATRLKEIQEQRF